MTSAAGSGAFSDEEDGGLRRWWWVDFGLPLAVLAVGTALFWSGEWDLALQRPHFSEDSGWREDAQPWKALYDYGVLPTGILTVAGILVLLLGYRMRRLRGLRAPAVFVLLVIAIGPGLIANLVLKDHWNRPRPRAIEEFGGRSAFEPLLRIDPGSRGKSFPCGHASAVFALGSLWYLLRERRRSRALAKALLILVLLYGGAMCYARMIQGGHFGSDCLWAYGLLFLTMSSIYWFLRKIIRKCPVTSRSQSSSNWINQLPNTVKVPVLLLLVALFATFLLFVPYRASFEFVPEQEEPELPLRFALELPLGQIKVRPGEKTRWISEASGFGYAGSRLSHHSSEELAALDPGGHEHQVSLRQRVSGFFSEIMQSGELSLPMKRLRRLDLRMEEGDLSLCLPGEEQLASRSMWKISGQPGVVVLVVAEDALSAFEIRGLQAAPRGSQGLLRHYRPGIWRAGGIPQLVIENETEGAEFRIERPGGEEHGSAETEAPSLPGESRPDGGG